MVYVLLISIFIKTFFLSKRFFLKNEFIIFFFCYYLTNTNSFYNIFFLKNNLLFFWNYVEILNSTKNSFFIIIIISFLLSQIYNLLKINYNFVFLFVLFCFNDYFFLRTQNQHVITSFIENTTLINGVILIHPFFTYITYTLIFSVFYHFSKIYFYKNKFFLEKLKITFLIFSYSAMILGSYWAQQELNWGGWWNWDYVEMVSFIFFVLANIIIHMNISLNRFFLNKFMNDLFLFIFIFFCIVRLDFLNSIHSFNSILVKKNLYVYIVIGLIYLIFIFFKKLRYLGSTNKKKYTIKLYFLFLFVKTVFFIFLLVSFFYNFLLDTDIIEYTKLLKYVYIFLFTVTIFFLFLKINAFLFIFFMLFNIVNIWFFLFLFIILFLRYYKTLFIHFFFFICVLYGVYYIQIYTTKNVFFFIYKLNFTLYNISDLTNFSNNKLFFYTNYKQLFFLKNYFCKNFILGDFLCTYSELQTNNLILFYNNTLTFFKLYFFSSIFLNVLFFFYIFNFFLLIRFFFIKIKKLIQSSFLNHCLLCYINYSRCQYLLTLKIKEPSLKTIFFKFDRK